MSGFHVERLAEDDLPAFLEFCRAYWPGEHPLIHNREMFDYYYRDAVGRINFAVARQTDSRDIMGVLGFIAANANVNPDIWTSYLLSMGGKQSGIAFALLDGIQKMTGARTIASNNIRRKTAAIYTFLGWSVGDFTQYYRLNTNKPEYTACIADCAKNQTVYHGGLVLTEIREDEITYDFKEAAEKCPYKDRAYFVKRYFRNPWIPYQVFSASRDNRQIALVVIRSFPVAQTCALRIVDFIGPEQEIPNLGYALDELIRLRDADFCDWFCYGVDAQYFYQAGFSAREEGDGTIIPFYLTPPVMENVTMTLYTNHAENYRMYRADGDQDRPNMPING